MVLFFLWVQHQAKVVVQMTIQEAFSPFLFNLSNSSAKQYQLPTTAMIRIDAKRAFHSSFSKAKSPLEVLHPLFPAFHELVVTIQWPQSSQG